MSEDQLKDVYVPSAATHQEAEQNEERRLDNRTAGIWLVSIYCLLSGIGGPLRLISEHHFLSEINTGETSVLNALMVLLPFLMICVGGIQLFRLRKSAFSWFVAGVVIRAPEVIWPLGTIYLGWFPFLILVALAAYAFTLRHRHVLD